MGRTPPDDLAVDIVCAARRRLFELARAAGPLSFVLSALVDL